MSSEARNYRARPTAKHLKPFTLASSLTSTGTSTSAAALHGPHTVFSLMQKRGTTSAVLESTKVSYKLQGSFDSTTWFTIGAATRAVSSTAWALSSVTSTAGITNVRLVVNLFTTSAGAATTAENRIPLSVKIMPVS